MIDRTLRSVFALLVAAGMVAAVPATLSAQETPEEQTDSIADEELERFARAYLEIAQLASEMQQDTAEATSPEAKQQIQQEARAAMTQALQERDLTPQRYREIAGRVNRDADLRQEFTALVQELRGGGG